MRVAHFVQRYPPAPGGSEAYFARLSRYLACRGDQVTVCTTVASALEAFWSVRAACVPAGTKVEDGVEVRRYPLLRWPGRRYVLKPLSLLPHRGWQCLTMPCNPIAWRLWADAGRGNPPADVVHATAFPYAWPVACGLRLARRLRVPFLLTPFLHTGDPEDPHDRIRSAYTKPALMHLARAANRVFVQTAAEREALVAHEVAPERLVLLGMGVDPEECTGGDRVRARRDWGVEAGTVVVGHLANNSAEKGTVDLLRAAERLWQSGTHFHVVLAGPEMPNFRRFWSTYRPAGRVLRLGVLDDRQKRDFFAGIDLFALPSRSDSFGLVLLEAWANGVPSVAYRAGGVAEVIRHGEDGLLVRCGDIDGLAAAFRELMVDEERRRRLGSTGRQQLRRDYAWSDKLHKVRNVYEEVVSGRRTPGPVEPATAGR
jgi:glycosyltransferase involved in cell wall biosynthesis